MRFQFNLGHFVFTLSVGTVLGAGLFLWSGYAFVRSEFPNVGVLKHQFPVVHYQEKGKPPHVTLQKSRPAGWTTLGEVSRPAMGAIVVSEDWAFYQHKGYDANQIKEAIKEDWEAGRFARGASTITQQVARNVFLDKDKNLWRKVKELFLAIRMEDEVGKRKILETYLNIAEWGEGVFGIRAAARTYFSKSPSELTAKEGAFLAMLLPSPKRYSQSFRAKRLTRYARRTVDSILFKMTQANYITEQERDIHRGTPLAWEISESPEANVAPSGAVGAPQSEPQPEEDEFSENEDNEI